ncbi:MAG: preprotein translocase subunit SecE [Gammaproteobacteria bacterium]|nr:MAG: preprotein translocase subunit SecE [Gammaproteobacteria bacterium]
MNAKTEQTGNSMDILKWITVAVFLAAAIVGNQYFSEQSLLIRVIAILVAVSIAFLVASTTTKGKIAFGFAKDSRVEARKVVWPTRQETVQTTLIIMLAVSVMSLLLWGIDGILVRIVAFALGQEI